jgi:hypothetical protein
MLETKTNNKRKKSEAEKKTPGVANGGTMQRDT